MTKYKFDKIVKIYSNSNDKFKKCFLSFLFGGILGLFCQVINAILICFGVENPLIIVNILVIFITLILTLTPWYQKLVQIFGMGLILPLSGFTNALIASSLEGRFEGAIYGIGKNTFSLVGSVLGYGILTSVLFSLIKLLLEGVLL
jgi:stage V sporulation protein AC